MPAADPVGNLVSRGVPADELVQAISLSRSLAQADDLGPLSRLLGAVAQRPQHYRLLDSPYFRRRFADDAGYRRLLATYEYGSGSIDRAPGVFRSLFDETGTLADLILAANCLVRPLGREAEALELLKRGERRFSDHPVFFMNLATAHFVLGQTADANAVLQTRKGRWEDLLAMNSVAGTALSQELASAIRGRIALRKTHYDETIYMEETIWKHWAPYYGDMLVDPPHLMFGWLSRAYADQLESALADDPGIDHVIDFGVMCAVPHYSLATRHPDLPIHGVDRQAATARLNAGAFGDAQNLHFHAMEIEDFLKDSSIRMRNGLLFHARTATLCFPEKLRKLYALARDSGVRHIALFENASLSRSAGRYLDFGTFPDEAVTFKNYQFIHDYKRLLDEAGYRVVQERRLFSPLVTALATEDLGSTHVFMRATLAD